MPALVPKERLHPNDVSTAMLKGTFDADSVSSDEIELFRRVCVAAPLLQWLPRSVRRGGGYPLVTLEGNEGTPLQYLKGMGGIPL